MKTLLATVLFFSSATVFANNSCDIDLNGGVSIAQTEIKFVNGEQLLYKIVDDNSLWIKANTIDLTPKQQTLVVEYSTSIRAVLPEIKSIALESIDLAVNGVTTAFDELLGENNNVSDDLAGELGKVRREIENRFAQGQTIYLGDHNVADDGLNNEAFFDKGFEHRMESLVEKIVKNSMGSLMMAVGQQLLFSGGDMDAFETRMETFGDRIETKMEFKADKIEQRADTLCQSVVKIDRLEEQLKAAIPQLAAFNVLTVKKHATSGI